MLDKTGIAEKTMNEVDHPSGKSLPPGEEEDDGAVMRAVRAFLLDDDAIDALDSDEEKSPSVPFSGDSSTDSCGSAGEAQPVLPRKVPTATKYPPASPRMVNRSRVRRQNEIFSLRQKSIALERRLAQIQREGSDAASAWTDSTAWTLTPSSPWQTTALEQRVRLEAAEREREKLRKKVSNYGQAIRRVRQFVRRQIEKESTSSKLLPLGISRQTAKHPDAPMGYEDISEYVNAMYARLDSVFQEQDLDSVTRVTDKLNKVSIQNEGSHNMSLEFVKSRVLPFDVDTTAKAVWFYHTVKAGGPAVQAEGGLQDTEDVLRRTFVSTYTYPHFKGQTRGRSETRRFVDKDRIIILECSNFHLIGGTGGIDGIEVLGGRILNWTVVSPPRGERLRTASGRLWKMIHATINHVVYFSILLSNRFKKVFSMVWRYMSLVTFVDSTTNSFECRLLLLCASASSAQVLSERQRDHKRLDLAHYVARAHEFLAAWTHHFVLQQFECLAAWDPGQNEQLTASPSTRHSEDPEVHAVRALIPEKDLPVAQQNSEGEDEHDRRRSRATCHTTRWRCGKS